MVENSPKQLATKFVSVSSQKRLSKLDWLNAGLKVLGENGPRGVRIDAICRDLNVTKGSFYWHFKDRGDLMNCLIEHWDSRETQGLIDFAEEKSGSPVERIWLVVQKVTLGSYNVAAEVAVRHWASQDERVRNFLLNVDAKRIDFFARNFRKLGFDTNEALLRAHTIYSVTLVREFMQTGENRRVLEARMRATVELLSDAQIPLAD